jgi:hypothetical protein
VDLDDNNESSGSLKGNEVLDPLSYYILLYALAAVSFLGLKWRSK